MKIEVGEYVRTENGDIGKANFLSNTTADIGKKYIFRKDIVKQSKNIIDLIEEGDYVNGYICRYITDIDTGEEHLCNYDLNEMRWIPLENIDIWESIATKEQFASIEYKI